MPVPLDVSNPPLDPPADCVNRLMWQLARRLFADHQPGAHGYCVVCLPFQFYPCVGRQLAEVGLVASFRQPDGAPWRVRRASDRPQYAARVSATRSAGAC